MVDCNHCQSRAAVNCTKVQFVKYSTWNVLKYISEKSCILVIVLKDLSRTSIFGDLLLNFCDDNDLNIVDKDALPNDTYTYVSYSWGSTSWLDHVICSADAKQCTSNIKVIYECVLSIDVFNKDCRRSCSAILTWVLENVKISARPLNSIGN